MKPVELKGQNVVYGKDQEQFLPLPACKLEERGEVITCWEMTDEELEEIKKTKRVYLSQLTFNRPLQALKVEAGLDGFFTLVDE